ncbi:MAG: tetratricopeptide repeat protein, partial [bacterium]
DVVQHDDLRLATGCDLRLALALEPKINETIDRIYASDKGGNLADILDEAEDPEMKLREAGSLDEEVVDLGEVRGIVRDTDVLDDSDGRNLLVGLPLGEIAVVHVTNLALVSAPLAADQGFALAQYNLGHMYHTGRGVPQDDAEAVKWYRVAAEQGFAPARYIHGLMYANGRGVPQDHAEALRWFRAAAEQVRGEVAASRVLVNVAG